MTTTDIPPPDQQQQPAPAPQQGLPPTGLQQQLSGLNQTYQAASQAPGGYDPQVAQFQQGQQGIPSPHMGASTSLDRLAQDMAKTYGLSLPRGNLVDKYGNLTITPDQLAQASGGRETMGTAAAKLGYISDAIAKYQNEQQQEKARAAVATGIGQVQQRGRGSLASLQMGAYRDLADLYANQEYERADFSYFIQKEQQDIAMELQRRQEKMAKKRARFGFVTGVLGVALAPFTGGASLAFSGGLSQGGDTGWF